MSDEPILIVHIHHIRAAGICVSGARTWFPRYGLDFRDFLENGIDAQILRDTGDPLAARAVAEAEKDITNG